MSYDDLATALREHGVPFDTASLRTAFDSQPPEAADWVQSVVGSDTLLTRDELELYTALEKSGRADKLVASAAATGTDLVPLSGGDNELKAAVDELNRSTAAISKQTETLRQQQDAIRRLVKMQAKDAEARAAMENQRAQTLAAERRALVSEVEEMVQKLQFQVGDLEQSLADGDGSFAQTVDVMLRSDDTLLASLQKLGWELETEDPEEKDGVVKLREICARLIKYAVETLRTRLDRVYLESLEASGKQGGQQTPGEGGVDGEVAEMQAELDELYTEILPVAQMSAEQQFLEPAVRSLTGRSAVNVSRSVEALNYIDSCLDYLLTNISAAAARVEDRRAHEAAADRLLSSAKSELADKLETAPHRSPAATIGGSASPARPRRKSSSAGATGNSAASPIRPRDIPRRRSSGLGSGAGEPPLETLLRSLALPLPSDRDPESHKDHSNGHAAALEATLVDRTSKTSEVARNVQASFESGAAARLADVARAVGVVRESVLAESTTARAALLDPGVEGSIEILAQEVARVRARLEDAERELAGRGGGGATGKSSKRDELIKRWVAAR